MQSVRGALALSAFLALAGCTKHHSRDTQPVPAAPTAPVAKPDAVGVVPVRSFTELGPSSPVTKPEPATPAIPQEIVHPTPPPYVIEAPDTLQIEVVMKNPQTGKEEPLSPPLSGTFVVRPDGAVNLGEWGSVSVAGRTIDDAVKRLRDHLTKACTAASPAGELRVKVEVVAANSKKFYVIINGNEANEQVFAFPLTGRETVLDAIANAHLVDIASKPSTSIRLVRKRGAITDIDPIDWRGITQHADAKTNYTLQPNDRVYVTSEK